MLLAQIEFLRSQKTGKIGSPSQGIIAPVSVSDGCLSSLNTYLCLQVSLDILLVRLVLV